MARFCTNCGMEIKDGIAFCTECGTAAPTPKPQQQTEAPAQPVQETAPVSEQTEASAQPLQEKEPAYAQTAPQQQAQPAYTQTAPQQQAPAYAPPPMPVYAQTPPPAPAYAQTNVNQLSQNQYDVVGTGWFFGMMFLFSIPVIGWLICIIMAFTLKNKNKKHYAIAMLIWLIIGFLLAVALYLLFSWLGGMLVDYINSEYGGQLGDFQEIFEQFNQLGSGGISMPTE